MSVVLNSGLDNRKRPIQLIPNASIDLIIESTPFLITHKQDLAWFDLLSVTRGRCRSIQASHMPLPMLIFFVNALNDQGYFPDLLEFHVKDFSDPSSLSAVPPNTFFAPSLLQIVGLGPEQISSIGHIFSPNIDDYPDLGWWMMAARSAETLRILEIDVSNLQVSHRDETVQFELKLPLLQHLTVITRTLQDIVPFLDHLEIPKLGYW